MMIADSQVHLWGDETPDRPWIPGGQERLRHMGHLTSLGPDFLLGKMDEAGIDRAVIVPPTWDHDRIDVALQAWHRFPDRFRVMTRIPVNKPEEAKAMLRSLRSEPAVAGVRLPSALKWSGTGSTTARPTGSGLMRRSTTSR